MLPQLTRLKLSGSSRLKTVHPSWCTLPSLLVSRGLGACGAAQ